VKQRLPSRQSPYQTHVTCNHGRRETTLPAPTLLSFPNYRENCILGQSPPKKLVNSCQHHDHHASDQDLLRSRNLTPHSLHHHIRPAYGTIMPVRFSQRNSIFAGPSTGEVYAGRPFCPFLLFCRFSSREWLCFRSTYAAWSCQNEPNRTEPKRTPLKVSCG
jgi:hypothetical protein